MQSLPVWEGFTFALKAMMVNNQFISYIPPIRPSNKPCFYDFTPTRKNSGGGDFYFLERLKVAIAKMTNNTT